MPLKESFKKRFESALRIGVALPVGLSSYAPVFSSQEKAGSLKENGHTRVLETPLGLNGIPPLETPDGRKVVFGNTEREQVQSQEVSVFGVSAEFTDKGNIIISTIDGRKQEINLPPLAEFYSHFGGMKFSPDGRKLVVWRDSHDKGKEGYTLFLISPQTGEFRPIFSDFMQGLDYLPRVVDLDWSQDSKKLRISSDHHGRGEGIVVDIDTEQVLFEYQGGTYGKFSPDGNWFARVEGKDLEVRRISDGYKFTIRNNGGGFSWSPDSQSIVLQKCMRWTGTAWGDICEAGMLSLYNLSTGRATDNIAQTNIKERPVFSPDGKKILFDAPRSRSEGSGLRVYHLETRRIIPITIPERVAVFGENWRKIFHKSGLVLVYPTGQKRFFASIRWFDPDTGRTVASQEVWVGRDIKVEIKGIVDDNFICEFTYANGTAELYRAPLNPQRNGPIERFLIGPYIPQGPLNRREELFGFLKDGDLLNSDGQNFLFSGGVRRLIEHEETAEYFGGPKSSIPEGLTAFIPEGEPVEFRPGDVIGHKDLGIWYLRNGKRYKIQNWEWFKNNQRFNVGENLEFRRGEWTVSRELIERIPEGEVPQPAPGETFIRDWDGSFKEFQPFGGRMFIFMGGHGSSSEGQKQTFGFIKSLLREYGQSDFHFGEGTYNVMETERGLIPLGYSHQHTYRDPLESIRQVELSIQWYKERFPLTKFVLIGHSLGGFVLFNAAYRHADAVEAVLTLDSPIGGIDKSLLTRLTEVGDEAVARWAKTFQNSVVGRFLVEAGDNPKFLEEAEAKAWHMISRGVTVITATNDDDILIPSWSAVLQNSVREAEKKGIQLVWQLGHANLEINIGDWSLNFRSGSHGLILGDRDVWVSYTDGLSLP